MYDAIDVSQVVVGSHCIQRKQMGWWLVIGEKSSNSLLSVKKLTATQTKASNSLMFA